MNRFACVLFVFVVGCSGATETSNDADTHGIIEVTKSDLPSEMFDKIRKRYGEGMNPA